MNISNLNELLNTFIKNKGQISSIDGFAINSYDIKNRFALFSNNDEEIQKAIENGAYAIIYDKEDIQIQDKEIFYLKSNDLEEAILRLFRYKLEEKKCKILYLDKNEMNFCESFGFKKLLGNVFLDFESIVYSKENDFFCYDDLSYILKLSSYYEKFDYANYNLIKQGSVFFTSIVCENLLFKNMYFPYIYADIFAKYIKFCVKNNININFNKNKLDFFKIFFVNNENNICKFGSSNRAFILVFKDNDYLFFYEKFKNLKNFKTASKVHKNSDFYYENINDLKKFYDFKYCLILEKEEDFVKNFEKKDNENILSLF